MSPPEITATTGTPFAKGSSSTEDGNAHIEHEAEPREMPALLGKPDDEIATLKAELSAMQQRLEQLSRR